MNKYNYKPKSKYLRLRYESFYGFHYLTFHPYMIFRKGQEDEFLETIKEFKEYYSDTGNADPVAEEALKSIMKSSDLDWESIWKKLDINDYCGPLEQLFREITGYIEYDTFKEKVNPSDDLVLVQLLYRVFYRYYNIPSLLVEGEYKKYLMEALKRMNKKPEDILEEMVKKYHDNFERGFQPDTINDQLKNSKKQLFKILISTSNLNTKIDYLGKTTTLKNLLYYQILKEGRISDWTIDGDYYKTPYLQIDNEKHLKLLFDNCRNITFKGYPINDNFKEYDRLTLNVLMDYLYDTFDIFNNNNTYHLYQSSQLKALLETGIYDDKTPFTDEFAKIVRFLFLKQPKSIMNFRLRDEFMDFIYSPRIKVISHATLNLLKTFLDEEEYANYIKWITENNIPIYFGDYLGINNHTVRTIDNALNSDLTIFERYELNTILDDLNDCNEIILKRKK